MKQVKFRLCGSDVMTGLTDGSRWNGWLNVWVTPEVRDELFNFFAGEDTDLGSLKPDSDGLISLSGYCVKEVAWN